MVSARPRRVPHPRLGAKHLVEVLGFITQGPKRCPCEVFFGPNEAHASGNLRTEAEARGAAQIASAVVAHAHDGPNAPEAGGGFDKALTK